VDGNSKRIWNRTDFDSLSKQAYASLLGGSLYLWYDFARAMKLPKRHNKAKDVSDAIIFDNVNVFLDPRQLLSHRRK